MHISLLKMLSPWFALGLMGSAVVGCNALKALDAKLELKKTDCSIRDPKYQDPEWTKQCIKASSYQGRCIPASDFVEWTCLELDTSAELCEGKEPFNITVFLSRSGEFLDCRKQTITPSIKEPGIVAPYEYSISDILITDCRIAYSKSYGVELKRYFRGAEAAPGTHFPGHSNISLVNVDIFKPGQTGVYVGQNTENFYFDGGVIDGGYSGIYLEAGSQRSHITRAKIINQRTREGISLDSSRYNVIENSVFKNNGQAGNSINLYKNCGETRGQVCPIEREFDASFNTIRGNSFDGVINVAWRQLKPDALQHCKSIGVNGYVGSWLDHSTGNVFENNKFYGGSKVIVKDGPNYFRGNLFESGQLELGVDPELGKKTSVQIPGRIIKNWFGAKTPLRLLGQAGDFSELSLIQNTDLRGTCSSLGRNACSPPQTGDLLLPNETTDTLGAGLLAKLLQPNGDMSGAFDDREARFSDESASKARNAGSEPVAAPLSFTDDPEFPGASTLAPSYEEADEEAEGEL